MKYQLLFDDYGFWCIQNTEDKTRTLFILADGLQKGLLDFFGKKLEFSRDYVNTLEVYGCHIMVEFNNMTYEEFKEKFPEVFV